MKSSPILPPVVTVAGYSNSGKTRVASHLISMFSDKGYKVASIKHCHDVHLIDRSDSDTDKFRKAGAATVIASSPGLLTTMEYMDYDLPLESIIPTISDDVDIVIAEGFKNSSVPKVLVVGHSGSYPSVDNIVAVVSGVNGEWASPTYGFDQLDMLGNQLLKDTLDVETHKESISLIIDGRQIPLKRYPAVTLAGIVKGFVSNLYGVPENPLHIEIKITIKED